jgi:hypothetical protein
MPLNPSIALGVRPLEVPNQLAQYAQVAQIEGAQRQNEVARMQLEQLQQDRTEMQAFQKHLADNGGNPDLKQFAAMLLKSPKYYEKGVEMVQKLQEQDKFDAYLKRTQPAVAPAAPGMLGSGTAGIMPAGPGMPTPPAVNALAPTPGGMLAAAPAPVNALAAQPTLADLEARLREVSRFNIPQAKAEAEMIKDQIKIMRTPQVVGAGSTVLVGGKPSYTAPEATPADVRTMKDLGYPLTQAGYAAFRDAQRQDRILTPAEEAQRIRIANASRAPLQPAAPTITTVEDPNKPGSFLQVDARTYQGGGAGSPGVIGGARPSATAEKLTLQRTQMGKDLGFAITQLSDITKDGGLIDQSTGSGAGRLTDIGAGFFGKATPGAIAIGKIAPIADLVLKMVPRFEGPQSNKDTQSYKEAAGQLADASLPTEIRKQAGKTVLRLMTERKNQFVTTDMAAEGAGAAQIAPPAGFVPDQR